MEMCVKVPGIASDGYALGAAGLRTLASSENRSWRHRWSHVAQDIPNV